MKKSKSIIILVLLLFISLIFIFIGVSVAIFNYFGKGATNNVIQTGRVVFSYSDANGGTNGIYIQDAMPISDEVGKVLSGDREYFDFTVSATATTSDLVYEIAVNKNSNSTLSDDYAKIYLTTFDGNNETGVPLTSTSNGIATYSELTDTNNPLLIGKTVYYGNVQAGEVSYGRRFRLRMWVSDKNFDYDQIINKTFSVKVNVAATSGY